MINMCIIKSPYEVSMFKHRSMVYKDNVERESSAKQVDSERLSFLHFDNGWECQIDFSICLNREKTKK